MKPQPLSVGRGVSMLLVGMPGVGKTPFIASGANSCIIHPPADNMDSVPKDAPVKEIVVSNWKDMFETLAWANQLPSEESPDKWVWLDSISVWQDYGVEDLLKDAIERKPARAVAKGSTEYEVMDSVQSLYVSPEGKIMVPEFDADVPEYGINMKRIARWVRDMHGFAKEGKFNFGITAHPFEWFDPIDEEDMLAPWIQGKGMVTRICGYMNIIAYLQEVKQEGETTQKILFTKTPGFYGKDQFDCLPETKSGKRGLIDPTMAEFDELLAKARSGGRRKMSPAKKSKPAKKAKRAKAAKR